MTEAVGTIATFSADHHVGVVGSAGQLFASFSARVVRPDGSLAGPNEPGELWLKSPFLAMGYLNNPEGTKNAITEDGYFKTGDVGYLDEHGNFFITDRVKELIKYKGFQVPPAELEGLLASHEKIDDVAVLGIYREDLASEVPLAYVVPKQGGAPTSLLEKNQISGCETTFKTLKVILF